MLTVGKSSIATSNLPTLWMVENDGTPRLPDFGIAKELHNADDPDGSVGFGTDVYSLGVILYECLQAACLLRSGRICRANGITTVPPRDGTAGPDKPSGVRKSAEKPGRQAVCRRRWTATASGRPDSCERAVGTGRGAGPERRRGSGGSRSGTRCEVQARRGSGCDYFGRQFHRARLPHQYKGQ